MRRRFSWATAMTVAVALIAAGCGSSSSKNATTAASKPPTTVPTPKVPKTPSTPSTATTGPTMTPPKGPTSLSIDSPQFRQGLITELAKNQKIPAKDDAPIADCAIKKLKGLGYKTVGEAAQHATTLKQVGFTCAQQVLGGGGQGAP